MSSVEALAPGGTGSSLLGNIHQGTAVGGPVQVYSTTPLGASPLVPGHEPPAPPPTTASGCKSSGFRVALRGHPAQGRGLCARPWGRRGECGERPSTGERCSTRNEPLSPDEPIQRVIRQYRLMQWRCTEPPARARPSGVGTGRGRPLRVLHGHRGLRKCQPPGGWRGQRWGGGDAQRVA